MMQIVIIGLPAGAASALLFASVASGSGIALLLFHLAPLPILIAALGWSHWAGLVAALTAAASLGLALGLYFVGAFLVGIALPAWWLAYLALLARPVGSNGALILEWYPIGRLVIWATLIGTALVIVSFLLNFGTDKDAFQAGLRKLATEAIQFQTARDPAAAARLDTSELVEALTTIVPRATAMLATLLNVFNLWLAGRVVRVSGRLQRPWPDLAALVLPPLTLAFLALAVAGTFLPDLAGIFAGIVTASLLMAYGLLGLAVLHSITRQNSGRTIILTATYALIVMSAGFAILALAMLGVAETTFNIRSRLTRMRGPPSLST
jgi:Predicted membrane protein (DUF2232)